MEISFSYTNKKGETKERDVVVIHESPVAIAGFDMKYLDNAEKSKVMQVFGTKKPTPFPTERTNVDYDKLGISKVTFAKAFRRFNKESIL